MRLNQKRLLSLLLISAACSECSEQSQPKAQAESQEVATENSSSINTTDLADANYATRGLLEARKEGLAKESAELSDPSKKGSVDPNAADPYTKADYPDVVRRYGTLIPTINKERKRAATIAANDQRCDGVVNVQITDHGTRSDRHYMTECNNLTRVYFDRRSLSNQKSALVRTQSDMGAQGVPVW